MKTRIFKLNKLVRDKIVQYNIAYGAKVDYQKLEGSKYINSLINKLVEEVSEFRKPKNISIDEIADLQEILNQLTKELKISPATLRATQAKKRRENGGFTKGHFIKTLTLPANNKWAKYYAKDPKRFPEVKL